MTGDPWMDELTDQLRRAASAVAPTADAAAVVRARFDRRRRHRALATVAGSATLVALVGVGVAVVQPDGTDPDGAPAPVAPATPPTSGPTPFSCPQELDLLQTTPPIPDLADQRRIVHQLATLDSVWVRHAAPSALGVVALVQDDSGDVDHWADPEVVGRLARLGVAHTYEWDPGAAGSGVDAGDQVRQVLLWELDPVMKDVRRAVRGVPGSAGLAFWPEGGAIVVHWKTPVPSEVRELAGTRADGVRVEVRGATYSDADVRRAQRRLSVWLREAGRRHQWSSASACADGSGLVVGMLPQVAGKPGLAEEISDAVGMPVLVVPEDPPVDLALRLDDRPD